MTHWTRMRWICFFLKISRDELRPKTIDIYSGDQFQLWPVGQIFDAYHISATRVSTPKRCAVYYWRKCLCSLFFLNFYSFLSVHWHNHYYLKEDMRELFLPVVCSSFSSSCSPGIWKRKFFKIFAAFLVMHYFVCFPP